VFTITNGLQKIRSKPQPPPTMERLPQQIKCSSTLSQIGEVRHVSFAGSCQTHGDVEHSRLAQTPTEKEKITTLDAGQAN